MKMNVFRPLAAFAVVFVTVGASAEMLDRPGGIRIGQRMIFYPYVSLSASWDSNVRGQHDGGSGDVSWLVNPGFNLDYRAENWSLLLNGYYNYRAYASGGNVKEENAHTFGETLRWNWANSQGAEQGWATTLSQSFRQINMADDMSLGDSRGYCADRREFDINGGIRRNFNERWHSNANAGYYLLQYDNDMDQDYSLYGWQRWIAGLEGGFAPSPWTDFILTGSYQGYAQDNVEGTDLSQNSQGYSVQAGLGSYATERISYRALAGWSRFEYADGAATSDGFVYTISGNWKITDTLHTMLLASSYYQPSEREYASQSRVDAVSWGIAKSFIRGKLTTTFDIAYRHETNERVNGYQNTDYNLDIATFRLGGSYTLNRYFSLFCSGEWQQSFNSESDRDYGNNDYSRWRVSGGVRLTY